MSYIPQVVGITDRYWFDGVNNQPFLSVYMSFTPSILFAGLGTGFVIGDVGATVSLTGGTHTIQATGTITSVSGGRITGLIPHTVGAYTVLPTPSSPPFYAITGGSGTGASVTLGVLGAPALYQIGTAGFSAAINGFTVSIWTTNLQFARNIVTGGTGFGIAIVGTQITVYDSAFHLIYGAQFVAPPYDSHSLQPLHLLVSFDVPSQTVQLYINDVATSLLATGGLNHWGPAATHPVTNDSTAVWWIGSFLGNIRGGGVSLISVWMREGFTDLSNVAARRVFINADLSPVDPATYPSAQLLFYTEPGDAPSAFATNRGTGGAFSVAGDQSFRWAEQFVGDGALIPFLQATTHSYSVAKQTALHGTLHNDPLSNTGTPAVDFTFRPAAGLNYPAIVTPPSHGSVTLNTDGTFVYTPNPGYVGSDTFQYRVEESMPAPCQWPAYSQTPQVHINVVPPSLLWTISSDDVTPNEGGIGNLWMDQQYVNFADLTTRRRFVGSAGHPIPMPKFGDIVTTGTYPLVWDTVQTEGVPEDFIYGWGQGGSASGGNTLIIGDDPTTGAAYPDQMGFDVCAVPGVLALDDLQVIVAPSRRNNQVSLRWSDTRGASWANAVERNLGNKGDYDVDLSWRRLGMSRDRVHEISWSAPSPDSLTGIFVTYEICST